jgi:hypothetical protein
LSAQLRKEGAFYFGANQHRLRLRRSPHSFRNLTLDLNTVHHGLSLQCLPPSFFYLAPKLGAIKHGLHA